jgi:predicted DNA-binding protein (MmcQ/YjbR family)
MNVETIREFCLAFPQATEKLQWDDNLCFKIGEKIFVMLGLDNPRLCFKCTPESFSELIEREDIRPAPYVGRYKWVVLDRLDALRWDELEDLIRQSYQMVAAKVSGKKEAKRKTLSKSAGRKKSRNEEKRMRAIKECMALHQRHLTLLATVG